MRTHVAVQLSGGYDASMRIWTSIPKLSLPWQRMSMMGFILFGILLVIVSFAYSRYTWDLVAYVWPVLDDGRKSSQQLHAETWAVVKAHVPGDIFEGLTKGNAYAEAQYKDPDALASMVPMYKIKFGYVLLLKAVSGVIDPIRASLLISAVSTIGIVFLMFLVCRPIDGFLALAWLPVAGLFNIFHLAQLSTPDAPAAFFYCAGLVLLVRNKLTPAVLLFLCGAATRPDNIILNMLVALIIGAKSWPRAVFLFCSTCAIYLFSIYWADHIGWWRHFHTSLVQQQPTLVGFNPAFDPVAYARALVQQTSLVLFSSWIYAALAVLMLAVVMLGGTTFALSRMILATLVAGAVIHFVVFPTHQERVYAPYLFGMALIMLDALAQATKSRLVRTVP
jgi:hypothetical protein